MTSRPISPVEPTKKVQPNAHPYAIKTTSSALLSRSNSSPHSTNYTRHHYIPSAPTKLTLGARLRHRHSSSLSLVEGASFDRRHTVPAPLPTPPSFVVPTPDYPSAGQGSVKDTDEPKITHKSWRAERMPSEFVAEKHNHGQKQSVSHDQEATTALELYPGLPLDPRKWCTDEVTNYLETSLRSRHGDVDKDDSSLMEMLECVRTRGLTGRELLRLTDADLASTPLSDVQRTQLLERSRTLRVNVLRGRIYVDSYHSHPISDISSEIYSQSTRSPTPFRSIHGASASVDDLRFHLESNTAEGVAAFPPSPAMTLHRSNSVSDVSAQRYRDLARLRVRRRGRVKGLVETWERASSGSECSASEDESVSGGEPESESEIDPELECLADVKRSPESSSDLPCVVHDEPRHDVLSSATDSSVVQEPPFSTPPPPYTHASITLRTVEDEAEEPTIEELLASSSSIPLIGARAWEADIGLGETAKRIPVSGSADASLLAMEPEPSDHSKNDCQQTRSNSVRLKSLGLQGGIRSSKRKNAKSEKRVVTAIFTGSLTANVGDEVHFMDHHHQTSDACGITRGEVLASSSLQNDSDSALRALEESVAATRAQVDAFRLRLEQVEVDTARQEAELKRASCSNVPYSSESELRRRRSEANARTVAEEAGLPRDETVVEGVETSGAVGTRKTISLSNIARSLVARAMGWLFPYGHLGPRVREVHDGSPAYNSSGPGVNDHHALAKKKGGRLPLARMSCSIILVSCAVCIAVLRKVGLGRWVRRP